MLPLRAIRIGVLALALSASGALSAQQRPLPDGLFVGVRWFTGSDEPIPLRVPKGADEHVLGSGWGGLLVYSSEIGDRTGWTAETGLWTFKGSDGKVSTTGEAYRQRAVLMPFMVGLSRTVLNRGMINVYLDMHAGVSYGQYITDFALRGRRVEQRLEFLYGPHLVVNFNIFKIPGGYKTGPRTGISYFRLPGRSLASTHGTLW